MQPPWESLYFPLSDLKKNEHTGAGLSLEAASSPLSLLHWKQQSCRAHSEPLMLLLLAWFYCSDLAGVTSHGMQVCIAPKNAHRYFT